MLATQVEVKAMADGCVGGVALEVSERKPHRVAALHPEVVLLAEHMHGSVLVSRSSGIAICFCIAVVCCCMGWRLLIVRSEDGYQQKQLVLQGALVYQYEAISVGDVIVAIDDRDTQGKSLPEVRASMLYEE